VTVGARQAFEIAKGLQAKEGSRYEERRTTGWRFKAGGRNSGWWDERRDYPKLPAVGDAELSAVDPAVLSEMMGRRSSPFQQDDTRPHLASVFFRGRWRDSPYGFDRRAIVFPSWQGDGQGTKAGKRCVDSTQRGAGD